jgi:hypothetical protein
VPVREPEPAAVVLLTPQPVGTVRAARTDTLPPPVDEPDATATAEQAPASVLVAGEEAPRVRPLHGRRLKMARLPIAAWLTTSCSVPREQHRSTA